MANHNLIIGDVWAGLLQLDNESIDCVITSPPYWSQRDYGFEGQIGNESTINDYITKLVTIFRFIRQKLKPEGVFFLNIGDKYLNKYGNRPLGMIPFRMAYFLIKDGWVFNDTLIWYKVNHMPSSVKNRFTNTYEPVFVLSKNESNYYNKFKGFNNISKILRIPLQPLSFKHMATYPEKLVETLLKLGIPNNAIILDPFAGSGTTSVAVQTISRGLFNPIKMKTTMIEANPEYENIIKQRCKILSKNIQKVKYQSYSLLKLPLKFLRPLDEKIEVSDFNIELNNPIIKIFKDDLEFKHFSPLLFNGKMFNVLKNEDIFFLGLLKPNLSDIYTITQASGWIIRNMIIIPFKNDWIPIIMLVKDIKSIRYYFNVDNIRIEHLSKGRSNWDKVDFIGYRVEKSSSLFKNPDQGLIVKILSKYSNELPHWVTVKWDSGKYSQEEVINNSEQEEPFEMFCPNCKTQLPKYYHYRESISCRACHLDLWVDINSIPIMKVKNPRIQPESKSIEINVSEKITKRTNYNGKFKNANKINMGQSPGARASVQDQYFTTMRYYKIEQNMISDYLNIKRKSKGLSKKELTNLFSTKYKHTVGHWLRKDMGGSLPKDEDLIKLDSILNLDQSYLDYIRRTGIKLQTVSREKKGKNPGDFLDFPLTKVKTMLKQLGK